MRGERLFQHYEANTPCTSPQPSPIKDCHFIQLTKLGILIFEWDDGQGRETPIHFMNGNKENT